jgi:hypothetical protein
VHVIFLTTCLVTKPLLASKRRGSRPCRASLLAGPHLPTSCCFRPAESFNTIHFASFPN